MIRRITDNDIQSIFDVRVTTRENALTLEELQHLGITQESVKGKNQPILLRMAI